jgi:hypothetical protein
MEVRGSIKVFTFLSEKKTATLWAGRRRPRGKSPGKPGRASGTQEGWSPGRPVGQLRGQGQGSKKEPRTRRETSPAD